MDGDLKVHSDRFEIQLDQQLNDVFSIELHAQRYQEDVDNFQVSFASIADVYANDGLTWDGTTRLAPLSLRDWLVDIHANNLAAVLRADFSTGPVEHATRFGMQYSESEYAVDYGADGGVGRRQVSNTVDIFDPDNDPVLNVVGRDNAASFINRKDFRSVFGQWRATINDRLRLIGGLRFDDAEFATRFDTTDARGTPNESFSEKVSFRLAASYDLTSALTAFAGYSDSYNPQVGITEDGGSIDPLHNVSYEAGLKTALFDERVLWTNTIYQITRDDIAAAADPNDPTNRFVVPFGEVRIRGFESTLSGAVTENLRVIGGIGIQESENLRTEDPALEGNEFFNVPSYQISAFAHYRFGRLGLPELAARVGVIRFGEQWGSAQNDYRLPAYTRVDAGVSYQWDDTRFDLFVENVFDEVYYESSQGRVPPGLGILPGDPRLVQLNVTHRF